MVRIGIALFALACFGFLIFPLVSAKDPQPRIFFEDATKSAGIGLERVVAPEKKYLPESNAGGVAFLDYDGDGWLDIYLVNSPTLESLKSNHLPSNRLYRNNKNGTFTDVTDRAGVGFRGWCNGVSVADYNNDGYPDIYLNNMGPNVLYRNNGDGTFTDVTQKAGVGDPRWSTSSGWADYDGDGNLDLFVANYVEFDLDHPPQFGQEKYCLFRMFQVQCGPRGLKGAGDTLYHNNGDGTFTDVSKQAGVSDERGYYGIGVAWGDFDGDGRPDLYVANDTNANYLYWNNGDGTFREGGVLAGVAVDPNGNAQGSMGVAVGDYDNDLRLDLCVANFSGETNALYHNEDSRVFSDVAIPAGIGRAGLPYVAWAAIFADFDNDGWKDLFVSNGHVYPQVDQVDMGIRYDEPCQVFLNLRNGTFLDVSSQAGSSVNTPRAHRGAALGDYDNDGALDVLVMDLDGQPVLLHNRSAGRGNSLRVKAPVGSKVTVEVGGTKQMDEIRASGSVQSASEPVAHFGIGSASVVDRLTICFPGGLTRTWEGVKANQVLKVDKSSN